MQAMTDKIRLPDELGQYAAIHLKVPNSGTDWFDEMIEEANKLDREMLKGQEQ